MKTVSFPADKSADFKDLLKNTVGAAPEQGYSIDEVRLAIKVLDKIESCGSDIEFEDTEHTFVVSRISNVKWLKASPEIVKFVDCVNAAT